MKLAEKAIYNIIKLESLFFDVLIFDCSKCVVKLSPNSHLKKNRRLENLVINKINDNICKGISTPQSTHTHTNEKQK